MAAELIMIIATRDRNAMQTSHLQHSDATPLQEHIDDTVEPREPNINHAPEIRDMRRTTTCTTDPHAPRVAAMIQRQGQENHRQEWVTAWTPCYDVTGPGPNMNDTTAQWYKSPLAIEIPDYDMRTSKVRGIRQHEVMDAIGYDDDTRLRMIQHPPETNLDQMRRTPPKQ
jgi:hypothetical protein